MTVLNLQSSTDYRQPLSRLMMLLPTSVEAPRESEATTWEAQGLQDAVLLASLVFDVRRRRQLVVVTPRQHGRAPFDLDEVAEQVWDCADVVFTCDSPTTQALCAALPEWMHVWEGGTRIFRPGADLCDDRTDHRLVSGRTVRIGDVVNAVRRQHAQPRRDIPPTALKPSAPPRPVARRKPIDDEPTPVILFADPAEQFDHDLFNTWLAATVENERPGWPLTTYEVGPEFLESLDTQQLAKRSRVLRACVDVITGRVIEIPGREARRLLDSPRSAKGAGCQVLAPRADGAEAWRCNIVTRGAGAPRLLWWRTADGVELSRVVHHDDHRIA